MRTTTAIIKCAITVTTGLGNPKRPVELGNPNTCAEAKLCLFFIPAQEIVSRETEFFHRVSSGSAQMNFFENFFQQ